MSMVDVHLLFYFFINSIQQIAKSRIRTNNQADQITIGHDRNVVYYWIFIQIKILFHSSLLLFRYTIASVTQTLHSWIL